LVPVTVADRLSALSPEQRALFEKLRERQAPPAPRQPPPVRPVSGPRGLGDWPLSYDQERLWRLHQDDPGLIAWNVDAGSYVSGDLDLPRFLAALDELVRRHAAWRTSFPVVDGRPVQRVVEFLPAAVSLLDLSALPSERRQRVGLDATYEETRVPFDLARGPLLRLALVRFGAREHLYLLTIHHLVTDWITFQIFFRELMAVYAAFGAGRPSPLPPPALQYPDYVVWEREWLTDEILAAEAAFWRRQLAGFPLALELPTDRPRPAVQSQRGGLSPVAAGRPRTERLRTLARAEGATMFMATLAVLAALLWRFTGREKIVIGSNGANRARPELSPVVGFFLTQIPFAVDLAGDPTFRELLGRARSAALAAYTHQNLPFSRLIEALEVVPDPGRHPVVQVVLLLLEVPGGGGAARSADLAFRPVGLYDGNSRWDLMFGLYDDPAAGLAGPVEYNADIFEPGTIGRLLALFYRLLDAAFAAPDAPISTLPAWEPAVTWERTGEKAAR
jgi:hypothetical protein